MTKTEAIEYLEKTIKLHELFNETEHQEKAIEALNMAIEALEQETVSREAYDHEFNLRKELEMKVVELENSRARKIIRCKDCKHWHEWENGTGACHRSNSIWVGTDYDDFCSFAEKKGGDGK